MFACVIVGRLKVKHSGFNIIHGVSTVLVLNTIQKNDCVSYSDLCCRLPLLLQTVAGNFTY